tara:strand:+ start:6556 stop:7503 length:948 start_codon:yes stop_codon:yes gene_type:complete
MKIKTSHWLISIVFAIAVYLVILLFSDLPTIIENFTNIKTEFVLFGFTVAYISLLITGFRWYLMIRGLGKSLSFKSTFLVYLCGNAFAISPGRLGEVLRSFYLKRLHGIPASETAPTIIVERFFDVLAILVIALTCGLIIGTQPEIIFFGFGIIGVFLGLMYKKNYLKKILEKTQNLPFGKKISFALLDSLDTMYVLLKPKIFIKLFFLSVISWIVGSFVVYFSLLAFGINLDVFNSTFIHVVSTIVGSATFLPGGIGATEGGLLGLFHLQGISYNDAIGPMLLIRIIILWSITIFGLIINGIAESTILKKDKTS